MRDSSGRFAQKMVNVNWNSQYDRYLAGETANSIATSLSCQAGTVIYWFRKLGLPMRTHEQSVRVGQNKPGVQERMAKTQFKKGHVPSAKCIERSKESQKERRRPTIKSGYRWIWLHDHNVLEHQHVWCEANDMGCVPYGVIVHHINEDTLDNRAENLVLLDRSTHARLHYHLEQLRDERRNLWGKNKPLAGDYYG